MSQELIQAVMVLTKQKGFAPEVIFESLEAALLQAYRKEPHSNPDAYVELNRETGAYKVVVELKSVAREPGMRSKIAVYSRDESIDPVGACVGPKGQRVQHIVDELHDEKIDIVKWDEDPAIYIANSLSPAKVISVDVSEEEKSSYVVVPDYQLSLAIGKAGQNARLAAKLTNWKIDIKSETQAAENPFTGFTSTEAAESED